MDVPIGVGQPSSYQDSSLFRSHGNDAHGTPSCGKVLLTGKVSDLDKENACFVRHHDEGQLYPPLHRISEMMSELNQKSGRQ